MLTMPTNSIEHAKTHDMTQTYPAFQLYPRLTEQVPYVFFYFLKPRLGSHCLIHTMLWLVPARKLSNHGSLHMHKSTTWSQFVL